MCTYVRTVFMCASARNWCLYTVGVSSVCFPYISTRALSSVWLVYIHIHMHTGTSDVVIIALQVINST